MNIASISNLLLSSIRSSLLMAWHAPEHRYSGKRTARIRVAEDNIFVEISALAPGNRRLVIELVLELTQKVKLWWFPRKLSTIQ